MWEDHKYILWRRIKRSTLNKKEARLFMAVYSCVDLALAFFFNKMYSSLVANPNLTAVKIYGAWLLLHPVLQSSEVGFIANVNP
jgi:hypothetical protein